MPLFALFWVFLPVKARSWLDGNEEERMLYGYGYAPMRGVALGAGGVRWGAGRHVGIAVCGGTSVAWALVACNGIAKRRVGVGRVTGGKGASRATLVVRAIRIAMIRFIKTCP